MIVRATKSHISALPLELHDFAFGQDREGKVDLTVGKTYTVYGIRKNKLGTFYLVLTDLIHTDLPWWMPAGFFGVVDKRTPETWQTDKWEGYGHETVQSNPMFFDASLDIEDRTERGYEVFETIKREVDELYPRDK